MVLLLVLVLMLLMLLLKRVRELILVRSCRHGVLREEAPIVFAGRDWREQVCVVDVDIEVNRSLSTLWRQVRHGVLYRYTDS